MLVARRRLDRGDDLARDAQLREVAEARLAVGAVVADRLVEADEALLDEVVAVAAGQEVRRGLQADEAVVAAHEPVVRVGISLLGKGDQEAIIDLKLTLRVDGQSRHGRVLPGRSTVAESDFEIPADAPSQGASSAILTDLKPRPQVECASIYAEL